MKYQHVDIETGNLGNCLYTGVGSAKIGPYAVPLYKLKDYGYYPVIDPAFDANTQVVSEYYFDTEKQAVTRKVYEFAKGVANKWKETEHVGDELYRKIRIRVKWADTLTGGILESKSNDMLKSQSPFYRVNQDGTANPTGEYSEIYLNWISETDQAAMQAYCSVTPNALIQHYDEL